MFTINLRPLVVSPLSYSLSLENGLFAFEVRDALVGLGSRKSYRAIFGVHEDHLSVYRVLPAAEGAINADDLD